MFIWNHKGGWNIMLTFSFCHQDRCPKIYTWTWAAFVRSPRMKQTWKVIKISQSNSKRVYVAVFKSDAIFNVNLIHRILKMILKNKFIVQWNFRRWSKWIYGSTFLNFNFEFICKITCKDANGFHSFVSWECQQIKPANLMYFYVHRIH